ncbi:MAG: hypothetical protein HQL71_02940 [Magnetococcales bacterium]|nr:hypothetical protein [Magnetococcales bacterium]
MSQLNAGLTLDFLSQQKRSSFTLMIGDELGSTPIQVRPKVVGVWSRSPDHYIDQYKTTLKMIKPGVRRIRLYCSKETATTARLSVHTGSAKAIGRRQAKLCETLSWTNKNSQSLRFPYDNPTVVVVDKTRFFDQNGGEVEPPTFIPSQGIFHHAKAVTGAMVVEYQPEFSLFSVEYDMGEEQMEPERLIEMKQAWLAGNIRDCDIPQVNIIALADGHATQLSFARQFWPEGSLGIRGYANETPPPPMELLAQIEDPDIFWDACWQKIANKRLDLTIEEYEAIVLCAKSSQAPAKLQYVETSRDTKVDRIFNQNSDDIYIDVERPTTLTMKLSRVDGNESSADWDLYPYQPEITFRFNS